MEATVAPLHGLVLSGGHSLRMGRDKGLIEYSGQPQVRSAYLLLQPLVRQCFVSLREDQQGDRVRGALPGIVDGLRGIGPAAGLLAAHGAFPDAAWLAVACDLPMLDTGTLAALIAARGEHDAVAYRSAHDDLLEPLCTVWEPAALRALALAVQDGRNSLRAALAQVRCRALAAPAQGALRNINTPADRGRLD